MDIELITVFSVMSIIFSLLLARLTMSSIWALSPQMMFVGGSITFINIGFIQFYSRYSHEEWAFRALLSASLGLLMVALGGFVGYLVLNNRERWKALPTLPINLSLTYSQALISASFVFSVVILYFVFLGYAPLISGIQLLLTHGFVPGLVNTFRIDADPYINPDAAYIPLQGLMDSMRYFGLPIVALWFLTFLRQNIHRKVSMFMIGMCVLLIMLTGQRWPLMYLLITFLIYWTWTEPDPKQVRNIFIRLGMTALLLGVTLSALLGRTNESGLGLEEVIFFAIGDLFNRLFVGNVMAPFISYGVFPQDIDWLYGSSYIQNILSFLPGQYESFPVTFNKIIVKDGGFTAPPDFYTEAYINFGWFGTVGISFCWGLMLSVFQRLAATSTDVVRRSFFCLICTLVGFSAVSGVIFICGGFIIVTLIAIFIFGLTAFSKKNRRNKQDEALKQGSLG